MNNTCNTKKMGYIASGLKWCSKTIGEGENKNNPSNKNPEKSKYTLYCLYTDNLEVISFQINNNKTPVNNPIKCCIIEIYEKSLKADKIPSKNNG